MPVVSVNAALYVVFQSAIPVTSSSPFSPVVVYVMAGVIEAIPFVLQEAAVLNASPPTGGFTSVTATEFTFSTCIVPTAFAVLA